MSDADDERIVAAYNARLDTHGYDPRTLGWDKGRHHLRFEVLCSHWDLAGLRVLDFGCGFGDLFGYLREQGVDAEYHGIDINPRLVDEGRSRFPDAHLEVRDVLKQGLEQPYDVILSSGVHNISREDAQGFTRRTFQIFAQHAEVGFACNFLSSRVDRRLDHAHHSDPVDVLGLCYEHSRRVVLRNDYMPFEFTVFVDMRQGFDGRHVVYPEYVHLVREVDDDG